MTVIDVVVREIIDRAQYKDTKVSKPLAAFIARTVS